MAKFIIENKEVFNTIYEIEAESETEALELFKDGAGKEIDSYFLLNLEDIDSEYNPLILEKEDYDKI